MIIPLQSVIFLETLWELVDGSCLTTACLLGSSFPNTTITRLLHACLKISLRQVYVKQGVRFVKVTEWNLNKHLHGVDLLGHLSVTFNPDVW